MSEPLDTARLRADLEDLVRFLRVRGQRVADGEHFEGRWADQVDGLLARLEAASEPNAVLKDRLEGWLTEDELPGEVPLEVLAQRVIDWGDQAWHTAGLAEEAREAAEARLAAATEALRDLRIYAPMMMGPISRRAFEGDVDAALAGAAGTPPDAE